MKNRIALAIAFFSLSAAVQAATSPCEQKAKSIETRLFFAEKHSNSNEIAGLKKALQEVRSNCNDADVLAERQKKVAEKRADVAERRQELTEAQAKGDANKIAKRERKLAIAEQQLKALEAQSN
ncbi:DUF1090 domain-containing protein [Enterobacteriaceae bacterium 4M9]|nr:DUF1090 domain-containing protein [Enterobacteriaceae bacterium 4M9]